MTITFRPMAADDRQFVISTWSSSFRTSRYAGLVSNATWADVMHREIGAILDRPTTRTIVACEPSELDHLGRQFLYGFIATRTVVGVRPYVYYCYVKKKFRRRRIARRLFDAAGIDAAGGFVYACRTGALLDVATKIPGATWDPVPAREGP